MHKSLIIHANCQGEMLLQLLQQHPVIAATWHCRLFTNYIREAVPPDALGQCDVFLYQHLGTEWGALASDQLLRQLPRHCFALCIPNYFWRLCWPLQYNAGEHVLRDRLLEDLWQRKPERDAFVLLATRPALLRHYDIQGIVEQSLAHERAKEAHTPIKYLERVLEGSKRQHLFHTPNHPGAELLLFTVNEILRRLDLPLMRREDLPELDPYYTALDLPVHPGLAAMFGLHWLHPESRFALYGHRVTYAQFAWLYAEYRASGTDSFIEFMGRFNAARATGALADAPEGGAP